MITVRDTDKYMVDPKATIEKAFEGAYVGSLEKMPQSPPDYLTAIWGSLSILLVGGLYVIVAQNAVKNGEAPALWYALSAACVAIVGFILFKLIKGHRAFKSASGGEDKKEKERKIFYEITDYYMQPSRISANEYNKQVSGLIGKQPKELYNNGLRKIADYLGSVNSPKDISCKLLTPFGTIFNQSKKRFYVTVEDGNVRFADFDFANPKGEIVCSEDDVKSFGFYSKYPQNIVHPSAGKVRADSVILEIQDDSNHLYFEFLPSDAGTVKKLFGSRKEVK